MLTCFEFPNPLYMCTTFGDKRHVQMETLRFLDKFEWSPSYRPSITYKELKQYADCLFDFWSRDFVTKWSLRRQWSAQKLLTKFLDIFQRPNDASLKTTIFEGQCFDETKFQLEIITEQRVPPHCGLPTEVRSSSAFQLELVLKPYQTYQNIQQLVDTHLQRQFELSWKCSACEDLHCRSQQQHISKASDYLFVYISQGNAQLGPIQTSSINFDRLQLSTRNTALTYQACSAIYQQVVNDKYTHYKCIKNMWLCDDEVTFRVDKWIDQIPTIVLYKLQHN